MGRWDTHGMYQKGRFGLRDRADGLEVFAEEGWFGKAVGAVGFEGKIGSVCGVEKGYCGGVLTETTCDLSPSTYAPHTLSCFVLLSCEYNLISVLYSLPRL